MSSQAIPLQTGWYVGNPSSAIYQPHAQQRPAIATSLTPSDNPPRFLRVIELRSDTGAISIAVEVGQTQVGSGQDLSDAFETSGFLRIQAVGMDVTAFLASADTTEPYVWTPTNSAEIIALATAIIAAQPANRAATLTISDGTGAILGFNNVNFYQGDTAFDRVYVGATQIWEREQVTPEGETPYVPPVDADTPGAVTGLSVRTDRHPVLPVIVTHYISWGAPSTGGSADGYRYTIDGGATQQTSATSISTSSDGVDVVVWAYNSDGDGPSTTVTTPTA